jgi:AhpC/TSA antioxidant enzyme
VEVLDHSEQLGVRIAVVAFAAPESLARYRELLDLRDTPLFSDSQRLSYAAFGFARGSLRRVWLDPRVWRRYAQLLLRGRRLQVAHEDTLQLGGDVLADATGRIRWIYASAGPEDRPSLAAIRRAIDAPVEPFAAPRGPRG